MSEQPENARLAWRQAQSELQTALDAQASVAETADPDTLEAARSLVAARQAEADRLLQRYITHLGRASMQMPSTSPADD